MKLQLTVDSRNRYYEAEKAVAWRETLRLSDKEKAQLIFGHFAVVKEYSNGIALVFIHKIDGAKWYHVIHLPSMLCVGRVSDSRGIVRDFANLSWVFPPLADDPERRTLIATHGTLRMVFKCNLQYEEVIEDETNDHGVSAD